MEECLRPFHQESYNHLNRVRRLLIKTKIMVDKHGLEGIPDYGNKEFIALKQRLVITESDWALLFYAAWFHDLAKMAYLVSFWNTPGKFTAEQRMQLEAHARLFFFLDEIFNVPEKLRAMSVLHHYRNQGYPHNCVVQYLQPFLTDSHFVDLLDLLIHFDIYEGCSGYRGYQP